MQSRFLRTGRDVLSELVSLAAASDSWSFCTSHGAIVSTSDAWKLLEPHLRKLKYAIVGLEFHRSDPSFLCRLHEMEKLRVVARTDELFGPNVYVFQCHEDIHAIVGSVTLNDSAFESSFQAAVHTTCHVHGHFALAVEEFLHRCLRESHLPTRADLEHYAKSHEAVASALDRVRTVHWRSTLFEVASGGDELYEGTDVDGKELVPPQVQFDTDIGVANGDVDDGPNESEQRLRPEELDTNDVMAAIRIVSRRGISTQDELLRDVARRFGFERLGKRIEHVLKGHLRAAIMRGIVSRSRDGDYICPENREITEYERDDLVKTLLSVVRIGRRYEREEVVREAANYLGFSKLTDNVNNVLRNTITLAIRRGEIISEGEFVRRA